MRKRAFFILLECITIIITCTGCWNYREINKLSIVAGAAIDKAEQGKYKITTEIIDMHEGGREAKISSKRLESYGDTMFDAIRNTLEINAQRLYWGHLEIVILSQDIAKEGIADILDLLNRDAEPRLNVDLLVSKEETAGEILNSQSITTEIRSLEISNMLDSEQNLAKAPKVEIYQFINALSDEGISAVLPTVGLVNSEGRVTSELAGTSVFKRDRLAYMFNEEETKKYLFAVDKIKRGLIIINNGDQNERAKSSLEIMKNKTIVKPVYSNGKLSFDIKIKTKTNLSELDEKKKSNAKMPYERLKKDAEKILETDVKKFINNVQQNYDIDIFGFGKKVKEDMPDLWKKINPEWDEIFKNVEINVSADIDIENTGLMTKAIEIGD